MVEPLPVEAFVAAVVSAMVANGSATLVKRGRPIDGGRHFIDGRRLLGDGKTVEGFLVGLFFGLAIALTAMVFLQCASPKLYLAVLASPFMALAGDIVMSFVKRRVGLERGAPLKPVDQLDFIVAVTIWMLALGYTVDPIILVTTFLLVYVLHRATNIAAYRLGIKDKPW